MGEMVPLVACIARALNPWYGNRLAKKRPTGGKAPLNGRCRTPFYTALDDAW